MARHYKNVAENTFVTLAEQRGWQVSKKGWPDFFCINDKGKPVAVEVKRQSATTGSRQSLRASQIHRMAWLTSLGAEVYTFVQGNATGENSLIPFNEEDEWAHYESQTTKSFTKKHKARNI